MANWSAPQEFSPELNQDFLSTILRDVDERGNVRRGQARSSSLARGLSPNDPTSISLEGMADNETQREKTGAVAGFNYNLANMMREERLGTQTHNWHEQDLSNQYAFQSSEAGADRAFREKMAKMGYEHDQDLANKQLWGESIGAVGQAAGVAGGIGLGKWLDKGK